MHIVSIVGARPNFVKIAPLAWEIARRGGLRHTIIHTGQHYDESMSREFFEVLEIPHPDLNLGIGSASHGIQTGRVMAALEPALQELQPDWVVTVGDVNSTAAAALVAVKLGIRTAHVEAGLRSGDRTMPEEINRIVTDAISDLLLVTEQSGLDNLAREGIERGKVEFTGNVMIDSLVRQLPKARRLKVYEQYDLLKRSYLLVTLHRPSNVDNRERLADLVEALLNIAEERQVLFAVHPRTKSSLVSFDLWKPLTHKKNVVITEPLDYLTFLSLLTTAFALITDSGGIQEETTYLGIPCITLRPNTERPSTIVLGTNELVRPRGRDLMDAFRRLDAGKWKKGSIPPLWDGRAAVRIIEAIVKRS